MDRNIFHEYGKHAIRPEVHYGPVIWAHCLPKMCTKNQISLKGEHGSRRVQTNWMSGDGSYPTTKQNFSQMLTERRRNPQRINVFII